MSPVVFIHQGDPRFVRYAVAQSIANGYETLVVGDASVFLEVKRGRLACRFLPISDMWERAAQFAERYHHVSVNSIDYELFCYQRWYVVFELLKTYSDKLIYADSDLFIYKGLQESLFETVFGSAGMFNSAWFNVFRGTAALEAFLSFIEEHFEVPDRLYTMGQNYVTHGKPHVSDMIMLFEFAKSYPEYCADTTRWGELIGFDGNIRSSIFYQVINGVKNIEFRDGLPFVHRLDGGVNRFYTLHFQGSAKPLMQVMSNISAEDRNKLDDLSSIIQQYDQHGIDKGISDLYRKLLVCPN